MGADVERCPVCGTMGTYEHHADGWVTCSVCGIEANREAAEALEGRAKRTCVNEFPGSALLKCSECHTLSSTELCGEYEPWAKYCPNCGARVVSDEEQGHMVADAIRRLEKVVKA